ncbi:MAG: glucokinase [Pseudomonadota bacterium]
MTREPDTFSLVADIGGTNTRVALAKGPDLLPETIRRYRNAMYPDLETVLRLFVQEEGDVDCRAASVAIAGPVRDGRGTLTNLDWTIDEETLAQATGAEFAAVLNDLQAQGHALGRIAGKNLRPVIEGPLPKADATQLVIGIGTGFNAAPVHHLGSARLVVPSEAGHGNLPIQTAEELRLCRFVQAAHGFPAVEEVLSGRGLERVHGWLGQEAGDDTPLGAADIMAACATGENPRAKEAVAVFVRLLGRTAGNLALDHLPFGGVYLAGGVARAMAPYFVQFGFADAFRDKGRFAEFMQGFSVAVIEDDYAALAGSAAHLDRISDPA